MPRFTRIAAAALLLPLLSACAVQNGPCNTGPETRELRTIDKLIEETRANLRRGYVLEQRDSGGSFNFCLGGAQSNVGVGLCTNGRGRSEAVAIDDASEQRKLAALTARRDAILAEIGRKNAACSAAPQG